MKLTELFEETDPEANRMPMLYLDMDGVQADFFGHWAAEHGVTHYKAIPHPGKAIDELAVSDSNRVYKFFRDLNPLPGGLKIISWLHKNKSPFTVLSAPLRGPYSGTSIKAKKDWLDQYNPGTSNDAIFTSEKFRHAKTDGRPNVLVDDYGKYLNAWKEAGGIAVKHENEATEQTIQALEEIYAPYIGKKNGQA